jgi:hypothetical protein
MTKRCVAPGRDGGAEPGKTADRFQSQVVPLAVGALTPAPALVVDFDDALDLL